MLHGKDHVCTHCPDARMSVTDEAMAVVKKHGEDTQEGRVVLRFLAFILNYGALLTVREQHDLLSRVGGVSPAGLTESVGELDARLRSRYMAMTSCCTQEFGPYKCTKINEGGD